MPRHKSVRGHSTPDGDRARQGLRGSRRGIHGDFPGISVEFTQIDPASAGTQWARLAIDSGLADLISIENPKFLFLDPMLRAGVLSPLDDFSAQYGWAEVMVPAALQRSSRQGQLWTLPLYYELTGVVYRKSVLDSVGGAVPATWEEFVALLTEFQDQGLIPLTVGHRGFSQVQMLHNQLWASIGGPDGIGTLIFGDGKWTDRGPGHRGSSDRRPLYTRACSTKTHSPSPRMTRQSGFSAAKRLCMLPVPGSIRKWSATSPETGT